MVKLPFVKSKKKFLVRLTSRGGRNLPIGVFEVKDMKELFSKITEAIQSNEEAKRYPNIRIVNLEDGTEVKLTNPFAEIEESEEKASVGHRGSSLVSELTIPMLLENIKGVMLTVSQFNAEVFKGLIQVYSNALKDVITSKSPSVTTHPELSLKDVLDFIKTLPELAKHKDEIEKLIKKGLGLESGKSET
jgi:hypothetical protein